MSSIIYTRSFFTGVNNKAGVNRQWEGEKPELQREGGREKMRKKKKDREEGKTKGVATRPNECGRR